MDAAEVLKYIEKAKEISYSRKETPWDNVCIESFHALIKREWSNFYRITNYGQAYHLIFE